MNTLHPTPYTLHPVFLVCPNAFKGSLTASEAVEAIAEGILSALPTAEILRLPLADGGDGTLEALTAATGGTLHRRQVHGPLGASVEAAWGRLGGERYDTAVIEMAQASGLRLLRPAEYDPLRAGTYGTGELMRAALEAGCRTLLVGIGGSATTDGGAGMAQALGARFLDAQGRELPPGGAALQTLADIDLSEFLLPEGVRVIAACDVDNPLCGPEGAAYVYGPQKGADEDAVQKLDAALAHYSDLLRTQLGADVANVPGAGAAGGLGGGLMAFCHATLQPGAEMVLDAVGFDAMCRGSHLAITGEGRLDAQTARGKLIACAARRAKALGTPTVALVGSLEEGADRALRAGGLEAVMSIVEGPMALEEALHRSYSLLASSAERLMRLLMLWKTP